MSNTPQSLRKSPSARVEDTALSANQVKFLHTADLQIGKTFKYLPEEAQHRYTQSRIDTLRTMGDIAVDEGCEFIVIAGDMFEYNSIAPATFARAKDALASIEVPVYILPGNHDPLSPDSIFYETQGIPGVEVISDNKPRIIKEGVELVGAPLLSKHADLDLVSEALDGLEATDHIRIMVGHGAVQAFGGDDAATIDLARVTAALDDGVIDYLALGDTHSSLPVEEKQRAWYSGAPEPTDFHDKRDGKSRGEQNSGNALVVTISKDSSTDAHVVVEERRVGKWCFEEINCDISSLEDVEAFFASLDSDYQDKSTTVIRLSATGVVPLGVYQAFRQKMDSKEDAFASLHIHERYHSLIVEPSPEDLAEMELGPVARAALEELQHAVGQSDGLDHEDPRLLEQSLTNREALNLFFRLSGELDKK